MKFYENLDVAMENLTKRGAFLTVKGEQGINTMTISWGYVGFSWSKPFFVAMVRPQRYTYDFIETSDSYTISIPFSDEMKNALSICGTKSGRDIDKEKEANIRFIPSKSVSSPVVDSCDMYYECKITYVDRINKDNFPKELMRSYPKDDFHYLYYGEIIEVYNK